MKETPPNNPDLEKAIEKKLMGMMPGILKGPAFRWRKVTDTPTDDLQVVNKKYVDDNGGGSPGGSDTQVQFNDGGSFGGDAGLTYDKTADELSVGNIVVDGQGNNPDQNIVGAINIKSPSLGENGGSFQIVAQNASGGGNGGDLELYGGNGSDGSGGNVEIYGGNASTAGLGGYILVTAGNGKESTGGEVQIRGGQGGASNGGDTYLLGGGAGVNSRGGDVFVTGGSGNGTGNGGDVHFNGGSGGGSGNTGNVYLAGNTALATTANAGFPMMKRMAGAPTGTPSTCAMVYDTTNNKLYIRNSSSWLSVTFT